MAVQRYRSSQQIADALQWDSTVACVMEMIEWVLQDQTEGPPHFVMLRTHKADELFGKWDAKPPKVTKHRLMWENGATAAIYNGFDNWVGVRIGDWVLKGPDGLFLCREEDFAGEWGLILGDGRILYDETKTQMSVTSWGLHVTIEYDKPGPELSVFESKVLTGTLNYVESVGKELFERRDPDGYHRWRTEQDARHGDSR